MALNLSALIEPANRLRQVVGEKVSPFFVPPSRKTLLEEIRTEEEEKKRQARTAMGLPAMRQEELRRPTGGTADILETIRPQEQAEIRRREAEYFGVGVGDKEREVFVGIPFLGGTVKKLAKGLEPIVEKLKGMDKPTFLRQFEEGLASKNLTTRDTARNVEALIKKSGYKGIGAFFDAYGGQKAVAPKVNTSALTKPAARAEVDIVGAQKAQNKLDKEYANQINALANRSSMDDMAFGNFEREQAAIKNRVYGESKLLEEKQALLEEINKLKSEAVYGTDQTAQRMVQARKKSIKIIDEAISHSSMSQAKASGMSFDEWVKGQAIKSKLETNGVKVNPDNTVTLYHATLPDRAVQIEKSGVLKPGGVATGGMTGLDLQPSAFLGTDKKWVADTWGQGGGKVIEIKVPVQDIRQPAQNFKEVYFEGGLKRGSDGIWRPTQTPRSTFYDRLAERDLVKTRSQLKAEWDAMASRVQPSAAVQPAPKATGAQALPQGKAQKQTTPSISPKQLEESRKSSLEPIIADGKKEVKPNVGTPEEKLMATPEETASIKDILNRSEMSIHATTATGKPKTARDLAKEITENIKKQSVKLKDEEIAKLREKSLLGAETIDEIILRKRGIITDKEAIERAKRLRGTIDDVLNLPKGSVPTKEQLTAISQIVQGERELNLKLTQLIDQGGVTGGAEERALIKKLGEGYTGLDEHEILNRALAESTLKLKKAEIVLLGMRGEIGRSLQATKLIVDAVDSRMRIVFGKIKKLNTLEQQAFLERLAKEDVKDDKKFIHFLEELQTADFFDKVAEYSVAAKLWNPTTHLVNLGGNTLRAIVDVALTSIVSPTTIKADILGARVGLKQGLKNALRAMTDEGYASQLSKYIEEGGTAPAIGGKLGQWVRTPFRALGAGDEIFRGMAFQRSLYRQAYKQTGGKGMEELLKNPTLEMLEKATEQAKRLTFQEDMGEITRMINEFRTPANFKTKAGKLGSLILRFFLPFLKTPTNLLKQAVDFSPFGGIKNFTKIKEAAKAGNTETVGRLIGESVVGTALAGYIVLETLDGNITGGAPRNPSERDRFYREKKLPYAIKIGDTRYQYKRVDPFSTVIGLVADATTLADDEEIEMGALIHTLVNQMSDKTYLSGVADFMKLLAGEPWEREYALKSMILGASMPSFLGHAARSIDPTVRKTDTVIDRIKSQVPFVSESLPIQVNVLGENIERANKGLNYFFNPIQSEVAEIDPITKHLLEIDKTLPLPQDYFSRDGKKYELDAMTYSRMTKEVGTKLKTEIETLMRTPVYQKLSPDEKGDEIDKKRKAITDDWKDSYMGKEGKRSLDAIFGGKKSLDAIFR